MLSSGQVGRTCHQQVSGVHEGGGSSGGAPLARCNFLADADGRGRVQEGDQEMVVGENAMQGHQRKVFYLHREVNVRRLDRTLEIR